jgi:4-hydroxy-3-methylbut-2-en-1-yl diphosphate reductase
MKGIQVEIEKAAGFCPGVVKAVGLAEKELQNALKLFCLGEMVHNPSEVKRLANLGLKVLSKADFSDLKNETVLLRAHGEAPETYTLAKKNNLTLIDATCKIVENLQKKVKVAAKEIEDRQGQIVIFGKKDHPETIGLLGQVDGRAIVITSLEDVGLVDFKKPIRLFAQTTMNPDVYLQIIGSMKSRSIGLGSDFQFQSSVCGWMTKRVQSLKAFAQGKDLLVFVAGKNSSNGKFLFEEAKNANPRSYKISNVAEIRASWFSDGMSIGISGATSTPLWQLKEIAEKIKEF